VSWQRVARAAGFDTFFSWYVRRLIAGEFAAVWLREGNAFPERGGYVAVANHHSWWDGFIPYALHHARRARQPFALMMSDAELRRFPYFRACGVFSIDASSVRAARESVLYASELARAGAAVWIFPDGVLRGPSAPLAFTSGFEHAAIGASVPVVPVAMRFVMLDKQRPEVFVAIGEPLAPARGLRESARRAVEALLRAIDEDLSSLQRSRYRAVLTGRKGVDERVALPRS
jgi:1-acyl-sn-glycerol-3-phosphate acyltransferase